MAHPLDSNESTRHEPPMAFWVYMLRCADGRYYTGQTDDLDRRISEHQTGGFCDFTSRRRPVSLVWSEYFSTRIEALEAERRIKPWSRAKKEALIAGNWSQLSYYAKPPSERSTSPLGVSTSLDTNGFESSVFSASFVSSSSTCSGFETSPSESPKSEK